MFERFEVIPAVDLRDGEVVQLTRGDPDTSTSYGDPVAAARRWVEAGAKTLHVVDLDGAIEGRRGNDAVIEAITSSVDVTVQLGGGIRSVEDANGLLEAGVDRVILGTLAHQNSESVQTLSRQWPDGVIVSLDASEGEVVVAGWQERTGIDPLEAAIRYQDLGAAGVLYTDVDVEGTEGGVRTEQVQALATTVDIPIIASGGVGRLADVQALADAGAAACVVGTALYEGAFSLAAAQRAVDGQ